MNESIRRSEKIILLQMKAYVETIRRHLSKIKLLRG